MPTRPEIFISATSRDLKSCRQLVRDALLTLGCVPIVQEHSAPDARLVRELLRARIAACDAVIHLAGECYGLEPFNRDPSQARRSYTQMEYDMARELKKPVYTFICAPDFPYDAHEPEPEELRALQDAHRAALQARDELYQPVHSAQDLALHVRELQTRVEHLTRDLHRTRSWLGRGVAAALVALALIGVVLFGLRQHARRTDAKVTQLSDELDRYRQAIRQVADRYGKDSEPGRKLTEQEKFDHALTTVAAQQQVGVGELKTWLAVFVAQVRANPGADFYDRALADFAEKHFADAASNATKAAEQYHAQGDAAAKAVAAASEQLARARENERRALSLVGDAESAAGHYAAAIEPYQRMLALVDEHKDPLLWCDAAEKFENVLRLMGRYGEAETLIHTVIDKRTSLQGKEHADTLASINHLATVLYLKSDLPGAEALYRQILAAQERVVGPDDPATLSSVNGLANVLSAKNDLAGAEVLYRRAMDTRARVLGQENYDSLISVNNLANVLALKGDLLGAEMLYRRSLEVGERTLGPDHPFTLSSVNNLANVLSNKHDLPGAETLYRRALEARERTLGKEHPTTLLSINNLATLLQAKNDLPGAEALYRRALEAQERTLGADHLDTLLSLENLAELLDDEGNLTAAEPYYVQALERMRRAMPPGHAYRVDLEHHFSLLRQKQGRLPEALTLAQEAAAGAEKSLPENDPDRRQYEKHLLELQAKVAGTAHTP